MMELLLLLPLLPLLLLPFAMPLPLLTRSLFLGLGGHVPMILAVCSL